MVDTRITDLPPATVIKDNDVSELVDVDGDLSQKSEQSLLRAYFTDPLKTSVNQEGSAQVDITEVDTSNITVDGGLGVGTTFSVAAATRVLQPQSDGSSTKTSFAAQSTITPDFSGYIFIYRDSSGLVSQFQGVPPPTTRRTHVPVGEIFVRESDGVITFAKDQANDFFQDSNIFLDFLNFIGSITDSELALIPPTTTTTQFNLAAGGAFAAKIGDSINAPHSKFFAAQSLATFIPFLQTGAIEQVVYSGSSNLIDPTVYDDGSGPLVPITGSPNQAQIFRCVQRSFGSQILVLHGQELFPSLDDAIKDLSSTVFNMPPEFRSGTVDLGGFIVVAGATDFQDENDCVFYPAVALGIGIGGTGTGQTPLADAIFFQNFIKGPNAPIDPGDNVEIGLEKHEQRLDDSVFTFSTDIKNSNVTAVLSEILRYDTATGTFTITAPPSPLINQIFAVKHVSVSTIGVTIDGNGTLIETISTFKPESSFLLTGDGIFVAWKFDGDQWTIVG